MPSAWAIISRLVAMTALPGLVRFRPVLLKVAPAATDPQNPRSIPTDASTIICTRSWGGPPRPSAIVVPGTWTRPPRTASQVLTRSSIIFRKVTRTDEPYTYEASRIMQFRSMSAVKGAAVIYVKDLHRMESFYGACFRMNTVDRADDYCVLESEPLTLTLVRTPDRIAAAIVVTEPPSRRESVPIKLAFAVDSIDALRPVFVQGGGLVDPSATQWAFRGRTYCDGVDPEGNVVQLVEPMAP
jgi:predicted enzyme related to lactoylglutathione lyase